MSSRDALRRRRANDPLNLFLAYLADIEQTLLNRNWAQLTTLLRKRRSSHLPREVREELVFHTRSPRESLRAPVRFLRFQHRMMQLALGGETLPTAQTELPLESGFDVPSARRIADGPRRVAASELRFENSERDDDR
jgi:hypothetical protein